jgi:hypothetical protein
MDPLIPRPNVTFLKCSNEPSKGLSRTHKKVTVIASKVLCKLCLFYIKKYTRQVVEAKNCKTGCLSNSGHIWPWKVCKGLTVVSAG